MFDTFILSSSQWIHNLNKVKLLISWKYKTQRLFYLHPKISHNYLKDYIRPYLRKGIVKIIEINFPTNDFPRFFLFPKCEKT